MWLCVAGCLFASGQLVEAAGGPFQIGYKSREILLDGRLDDWNGVTGIELSPGVAGVKSSGDIGEDDIRVGLRALWDEEGLYLAVEWTDDEWDVTRIRRREAIFVDNDGRRRNRMRLYDNLMVQIKEVNYDYTLWVSPRADGQGPFYWQKLLKGENAFESATHVPVITPREGEPTTSLEIMIRWKQIRSNPKRFKKRGLPIYISVSDGDSPGVPVEAKIGKAGRLDWQGLAPLLQP